jgi:hypothetical protein
MSNHNLIIIDVFMGILGTWYFFILQIIPIIVPIIISIILTAIFTFIAATYWHNKVTKEKAAQYIANGHTALVDRVNKIDSQLALLNQAVVPLNTAFQDQLVKMLTHHHTPRVDLLLSKLTDPNSMTDNEKEELRIALQERTTDMGGEISPEERIAASILVDVVKLTAIQLKNEMIFVKPMQLKLVTIEADEKEKV